MRLQLYCLFYCQIALPNSQMCGRKFRTDNRITRVRTFEKTFFAESHAVNFFFAATVYTFVTRMFYFQIFTDELVHVDKIMAKIQEILNGFRVLRGHFQDLSGELHI